MVTIEFIQNPPTAEDLKMLYSSDVYENLLAEFDKQSKYKLERRQEEDMRLTKMLNSIQRRYIILNIPFEEVLTEFERQKETLLNFMLLSVDFFVGLEAEEGEFSEEEELGEENQSELVEDFGIARVFLLDKFCEAYLLKTGNAERLLYFLEATRMPDAQLYQEQITRLYKRAEEMKDKYTESFPL